MPADGHQTSPTSFAFVGDLDRRPFLAEAEAIVAKQAEARARHPVTGCAWSAMTNPAPEVEPIETVRQRLVSFEAERRAYLASPIGKARSAIAKACRICELNDWREAYAALEAVGAALSRGSGAERFVEAAQAVLARLPEGDAKVAVLLLGTELLLAVRAVAS